MAKLERIIIRLDTETGTALRTWFTSQGTTLAGAIQGFLLEELKKSRGVNTPQTPESAGYSGKHLRCDTVQPAKEAAPKDASQQPDIKIPMVRRAPDSAGVSGSAEASLPAQSFADTPSSNDPVTANEGSETPSNNALSAGTGPQSESEANEWPSELPYRAIVFDMDGTILDTLEDLYRAVNHGLMSQGLPPRSREEVRQTVGNGYRNLMKWSCPEGTPQEVIDAVFDAFSAYYADHCNDHTHPYPGIVALLSSLHEQGIKLAVLSNKGDAAVQELARLHFPGIFDAVCGQRDDLPRKPHRAMADRVLQEMGVSAKDACYVGDSEVDILCAANAELPLWLVNWGFRDHDQLIAAGAAPGELIQSMEELKQKLTQP